MKQETTNKQPLEDSKELRHVSTNGRYNEIRGILDRKRQGIDCNEDESRAIKVWVKYETLAVGNGSIELDEEIQELLPIEWGEAQEEIGNIDEHGKLKEIGLIKIYSPAPDSKEGLHTQGEWKVKSSLNKELPFEIYNSSENTTLAYITNLTNSSAKANAELIVKAVNERKALFDALEKLHENATNLLVEVIDIPYPTSMNEDMRILSESLKTAKEILNNAKNI